jgi:hypothetical protein
MTAETGMSVLISGMLRAAFSGSKFITKDNGTGYTVRFNDEMRYGEPAIKEFIGRKFRHTNIVLIDMTPYTLTEQEKTDES